MGDNMYCRFCGKQICDDSVFCVHCGKNLNETNKSDSKEQNHKSNNLLQNTTTDTDGGSSLWGLWLLLPIFIILLVVIIGVASSSGDFGIISRDLKSSDYTYETSSQDLTSYSITVIPKRDIDHCDIHLTLYNSKGEKLFSDTISKTNLKEGSSYTYTFDFGFVNSLSGRQVKYNITGKCK